MKNWLAYSGAFACGLGMAALCYVAAFYTLMTGAGYGMEGFILLAVICPVVAGLLAFGVAYWAFSKRTLDASSWGQGIAFVAVVTAVCFGLIIGDVLEELPATILLICSVFVGGGVMISRGTNA